MKKIIDNDIYIGFFMAIISVVAFIETNSMVEDAAMYPRIILTTFFVTSFWILFKGIKKTILLNKSNDGTVTDLTSLSLKEFKLPFVSLVFVTIYAVLINVLGFFIATTIFMAGFMYYSKVKSWKKIALSILGVNLFIYLLFVMQLKLSLPEGIFF